MRARARQMAFVYLRERPAPGVVFPVDLAHEQPATYRDPYGNAAHELEPGETPEDLCAELERVRTVARVVDSLEPREASFVRQYFGLGCDPQPVAAIGAAVGLSRERARQIIAHAMRRLRHPSRSYQLEPLHSACQRGSRLARVLELEQQAADAAAAKRRALLVYQQTQRENQARYEAAKAAALARAAAKGMTDAEQIERRNIYRRYVPAALESDAFLNIGTAADTLGRARELVFTVPFDGAAEALAKFPRGAVRVLSVTFDEGITVPLAEAAPGGPALRRGDVVRLSNGNTHRVLELPRCVAGELVVKCEAPPSSDAPHYLVPLRLIEHVEPLS